MKTALVSIYTDPDFYPPTINAILNLAERMDEVTVVSCNNSIADYPFPLNVKLKKVGNYISVRNSEKLSYSLKFIRFLKFTIAFLNAARNSNVSLILLYDHFALFSFFLVKYVRTGKKIWYHNHDMPAKSRRFSIGGFAARYESVGMRYIDFFSLPSKERVKYYDAISPTIPLFILPNYPSLKVYKYAPIKKKREKSIMLIYQGFVGKGHSLETLIELMQERINDTSFYLVIKGSVTPEYKLSLTQLAESFNVAHQVNWLDIGPYSELPGLTASCDIGIGINMNTDMVSQTQGTASNKIYEYAASGLPVILYNSEQFTKYLKQYSWAAFTDGSINSMRQSISILMSDLTNKGDAARKDFETSLNFEKYFIPVLNTVMTSIS